MSIHHETQSPPFFTVIYTSPPKDFDGARFAETASMLVALAATMPGYLGFENDTAAEKRSVCVCYWDTFASLSDWLEKAKEWTPGEPSLEILLCTTGCLWPWLVEEHQANLEMQTRRVA